MASRENVAIIPWIIRHKKLPWAVFKHPNFAQDNFKTPWNRLLGCRLFGHRRIYSVERYTIRKGYFTVRFCFNCYRDIGQEAHNGR